MFRFAQKMMAPFIKKKININQQCEGRFIQNYLIVWKCVPFSICTLFFFLLVIEIIRPHACLRAQLISVESHILLKQLFNVHLVSIIKCLLYEGDLYIGLLYFFKCSHFFLLIKCYHNTTFILLLLKSKPP